MNQKGLASLQGAAFEHIGEDGEDRLGQGRRLDEIQSIRDRQDVTGVNRRLFGVSAAA